MQRFFCDCGHEVFFENTFCQACGSALAFDPGSLQLFAVDSGPNGVCSNVQPGRSFHFCSHRDSALNCNWLVEPEAPHHQCVSCRLTRYIPGQEVPANVQRWATLESAKRRMLYGVLRLGLQLEEAPENSHPLRFDFLEDRRTNPEVEEEIVYSGHSEGVITINAAEADPGFREATRVAMNEPYRTLLGHFRHEIGHYYWQGLVSERIDKFRALFGNERRDYKTMLDGYYRYGPGTGWAENYISAYASSHPLEDWAETWAHYMHIQETLDTAKAFDLVPADDLQADFERWINEWMRLSVMLNALNRSIGNSDAYPFVLSEVVRSKLAFVHSLLGGYQAGNFGMA